MTELWVEKWRPKSFDDYVWRDAQQRKQFQRMINEGSLPHLLLSGSAGVGKTSIAKVLLRELGVQAGDILEINASVENGIDVVRNKITNFASTLGFGDYRYILLDEFDYLTPNAQAGLRNLMETYSNVARFILTCNYPQKIIPAIKSRCQAYHFDSLNVDEFTIRLATVLTGEGVSFDIDTLDSYVRASYPDLRKSINLVQQHSVEGKLMAPSEASEGTSDYMLAAIELFKSGKMTEARKLIIASARPEEYTDMYRFMYQNLNLWTDDEMKQKKLLLIIAKGLRNHSLVADPEINIAACLVELEMEIDG